MRRRGIRSLPTSNPQHTGSPETGEPVFVAIGLLKRPHGIHGEMVMDLLTDFPERIRKGRSVYLTESHQPAQIESARGHNSQFLVSIAGVDTPEKAAELRNVMVFVRADELPRLPAGEYYHHELVGLAVFDQDDRELGLLTEILQTGANDVYVITSSEGEELLVPVIPGLILSVDIAGRKMHIHPPEWE